MSNRTRVRGLDRYVRRLNKEIKKIEGATLAGLISAGIIIIRSTERDSPVTPVDTGNLRASRFMVTGSEVKFGSRPRFKTENADRLRAEHKATTQGNMALAKMMKRPVVILGYSAYYAAYVHEAVGVQFKRSGSGAKFFQSSIRKNTSKILEAIKKEVQIKI